MIHDDFNKRWPSNPNNPFKIQPSIPDTNPIPALEPFKYVTPNEKITKAEFEALKKEVEEIKKLLAAAKKYDEATGQKDCEDVDKLALLKQLAKLVGVDLAELSE